MKQKKIKTIYRVETILIRAIFFFAFPAAWATGFSGVKYLCSQIHSGKPIEMKAFLIAFCALALYTVIFGRFFCGKACAFGTYGDVLYSAASWIARKMKKKPPHLPEKTGRGLRFVKYAVLIVICLMSILGYSSWISGGSPWTAFSHILARKVSFETRLDQISAALFALCSVLMLVERRFFCRFLCPFGAVFSLLPILPFSTVSRRKSQCIRGCKACRNVCPARLDLPYKPKKEVQEDKPAASERIYASRMGECFQCGQCTQICPKSNAGCLTMPGGVRGIVLDLIKAAVLGLLCWRLI